MKESVYFSRQMALPQIGAKEQAALRQATVAIVGVGGLGCPAALALAGCGVGTVLLIDGDSVATSNLHRQLLYSAEDCGHSKAEVAQKKLSAQFPFTQFVAKPQFIGPENATDLLASADIILDCSDSISLKYVLDNYCSVAQVPLVYAAMHQFQGYLSVFHVYRETEVFRYTDIFPAQDGTEQIETCELAGVMTVVPQLLGTMQAVETIKLILGLNPTSLGKLLIIDALNFKISETKIKSRRSNGITAKQPEKMYILSKIKKIQPHELHEIIDQPDLLLIDIREEAELKMGSISNSVHVPYTELTNKLIEGWPELMEKTVVVYCNRGIRSPFAAEKILQFYNEISTVYTLHGGINAWAQSYDPNIYSY